VTAVAPLVVTGMHRSGTSLLASMLLDTGVELGGDLLPADHQNRSGYFEDRPFVEFAQRVLADACPAGERGWPDWGWTESEVLDDAVVAGAREEGRRLLESAGRDRPWGWKDPRSTVLLDFWDELAPDACYLFVYRPPWEVTDSMLRYGHPAFGRQPSFALRVWNFYNGRLVDFARRRRDRCMLVALDAVTDRWPEVAALVSDRLGLTLADAAPAGADPALLVRDAGALEAITRDRAPWAVALLDELEEAADLPARIPPSARESAPAVSILVPCYNGGPALLEAVASCDLIRDVWWEVVLVDDGSDDPETCRLVEQLDSLGYRVVRQSNQGLGAACNAGLRLARGRYVLQLDQDNRLRAEYVDRGLEVMEREPEVAVVYGDAQCFGARDGRWTMGAFDLGRMLRWNHIDSCAVIRRAALDECGGYDDTLALGPEDWDLWLGLAERGWRFHYVPEVLFDYRVAPGSMVAGLDEPERRRDVVGYLVAKHRALYAEHLPEVVAGLQQWIGELYGSASSLRTERDELIDRTVRAEGEADERRAEAAALRAEIDSMRATRTWRMRNRLLGLLRRNRGK
jgi:hypothetical protein